MPTSRRIALGIAGLALLGAGLSALAPASGQDAQQTRPESILPPGFGEPAQPAPAPSPRSGEIAPPPIGNSAMIQPLPTPTPSGTPTATPTPIDPKILAQYEMPAFARRSLDRVGPTDTSEGGLDADAFGRADGRYLETLMRRLDAPLPSRWMSILLRRTLLSQLDTPANVNGADFAAERAWLLLRMGESVSARAVVQGVDTDNYTPKLYNVAMNAALATADPAALCPLADGGFRATGERGWVMAQAMCAGLSGEPAKAAPLIAAARRRGVASGVDLLLAQKVVGAGADGRQAVTIEWNSVDQLTAWRFGLAIATGVTIPDALFGTVGRQIAFWRALAPAIPLAERVEPAEAAAAQGVLSNAALVDLYGQLDSSDEDGESAADATADDLRTAYADRDAGGRASAIRGLWNDPTGTPSYARLVLTARAAARIMPSAGNADADRLIASMLSAGLDRTAARWAGSVKTGGDGWAMLMLADPDRRTRLAYRDLASYSGSGDAALKQRMFFAGIAGLGRLAPGDVTKAAEALAVPIGRENGWTRALDRAVQGRQQGTVALLAAVGMQTRNWHGVPPESLYRIVAALRAVGLEGEARMIAAESLARL